MEHQDGGPAFPVLTGGEQYRNRDNENILLFECSSGMSLRDYFAAKAMHAELNTSGWHAGAAAALSEAAHQQGHSVEQQIAFNAYALADAMLAERSK